MNILSFRIYFFGHNYQLVWDSKFKHACTNFPSQSYQKEFLLLLATSDNRYPLFYNLFDFPISYFTNLTFDNHSIDKRLEHPLSVRPDAKRTPQSPSIDTVSVVSLQTIPSSCNISVNTHHIGIPPPPSSKIPITTNRFLLIHHTDLILLITLLIQHFLLPPNLLSSYSSNSSSNSSFSFHSTITTQPQPQSSEP